MAKRGRKQMGLSRAHPTGEYEAAGRLVPTPLLGHASGQGQRLFQGRGCGECRGTGYRGRSGIYELFTVSEEVRSLILRKAPTGEIRRYATDHGMVTLRGDGWAKARAGLTTVAEVLRVTQEDS